MCSANKIREKIRAVSRRLKVVMSLLMFVVPLLLIGVWIFFDKLPKTVIYQLFMVQEYSVGPLTPALGFSIAIIQSTVSVLLFYHFRRLFSLYEQGIILTSDDVHRFKELSYMFFLQVVVNIIMSRMYVIILIFYIRPGNWFMLYGLTPHELLFLIFSFLLMLIGWVMDEACKVNDELSLVI